MPANLVNETLDALNQGVTQQFQEGRFTSQVGEMVNCIPTLSRGILRRNPTTSVTKLQALNLPAKMYNAFAYTYDRGTPGEQYMVIVPGDGTIHVFNANTGTHLYSADKQDYLTISPILKANEQFEALTIGDHTFIINKTKKPDFDRAITAPSTGYSKYAFYWIKKTTGVVTRQVDGNSELKGYTYYINNFSITGKESTILGEELDLGSADKIAAEIAANSSESLLPYHNESFAYETNYQEGEITWSDTFGNEASLGVYMTTSDSSNLPATLPKALDGFIVQITGNTESEVDDYYLIYSDEDKVWKETPAPNVYTTLDPTTMPHVLYRLTSGFEFNTYQKVHESGDFLTGESAWIQRHVRGQDELDDPSFIGETLTGIFFHKNRLGFLTRDSVILSGTNDYGNFFPQTALQILDDDPIDLSVASQDVTILRSAVSLSGQLLLFAEDTQFSLISLQGVLSPITADIVHLSNYNYDEFPQAKAIGNKVYFTSTVGEHSSIFTYKIEDDSTIRAEADNITLHLPSYVYSPINKIVGHDVLGYVFFTQDADKKELIVLNDIDINGQQVQRAFHRWVFLKEILDISIINNDLYITFFDRDVVKIALDVPSLITDIEYSDNYPSLADSWNYKSYITFSKFYVKDKNGLGTPRGRYQLRTIEYIINEYSQYETTVYSLDKVQIFGEEFFGVTWVDNDYWNDALYWKDEYSVYERVYKNDPKVSIMGNNENTLITFRNNSDNPTKGFELVSANIEGLFYQRSSRI